MAETQAQRPTIEVVIDKLQKALNFQENHKDNLKLSLQNIKLATKSFCQENIIGHGGFWTVYKGVTQGHGPNIVAAKRLERKSTEGEAEFMTELEILMEYKHENIIGLVGYCDEEDEKIIVYEYASRGSLDKYLSDDCLTWVMRLKICMDIAIGLEFLHGTVSSPEMVIHRDINSSNILLLDDWKAKISDFGLSLVCPTHHQDVDYVIENVTGTIGYRDPLHSKTGFLTKESDIFSLGAVLFDILCGKLSSEKLDDEYLYLPFLAKHHYHVGKLDKLVFEGIKEQIVPQSYITFTRIALQCLHHRREKRPTANEVEDYEKWEPKLPKDYKEIIQMSKCPNDYSTIKKEDLYNIFLKGILIQQDKVSSGSGGAVAVVVLPESGIKDGEEDLLPNFTKVQAASPKRNLCRIHASMAGRRVHGVQFPLHIRAPWQGATSAMKALNMGRGTALSFGTVVEMLDISYLNFEIKTRAQFLSRDVVYGVYLVFKFCDSRNFSSKPMYVNLNYRKGHGSLHSYFATWRDEQWMMIELYRFLNQNQDDVFEFLVESFSSYYCGGAAVYVEGIEFRAIDKIYRNYDKLFWLGEVEGKKFLVLSAKAALYKFSNVDIFTSKPSAKSRFQEVIELLPQQVSEKCQGLHCPVKVQDVLHKENTEAEFVYFMTPSSLNINGITRVPKQREDGWMEIQVWKFNSAHEFKDGSLSIDMKFTSHEGIMSGLIVCGLEFRPACGSFLVSWIMVCVLKACGETINVELGEQVHGWLMKSGYGGDLFVGSSLISFYGKVGCFEDGDMVFDQIGSRRNVVVWTARIINHCKEERFREVFDVFNEMGKEGVKKNSFTLSSVLSACSKISDDGNCGEQVHANAIKLGLASKSYVQCGLVNMYGKFGLMNDANRVFNMNESRRNRACWNAMLTSLVQNGCLVEAIKFLYQMRAAGVQPQELWLNKLSNFIFVSIRMIMSQNGCLVEAIKFLYQMRAAGVQPQELWLNKLSDEDGDWLFDSGGLYANRNSVSDEQGNKYLAPLAIFHYREKTLYDIIDRDLWKQMHLQTYSVFAETAYDCLNEERSRRPDIGEVVKRLEKALELQLAHENRLDMAEPEGKLAGKQKFGSRFRSLRIELEAIKSATNKFDDAHCIGKGGFGKVYKGELIHSKGRSVVALKPLECAFGQGNPEFWKEIIMLSLYKHDNIVSLLGFCDDCGEMILVYEYASKRSLDLYLNDKDLTWVQRLEICIGAARGLAYLHNPGRTQQRVLHRDIKSTNILLDENWNARIADLGLLTKESDVYSFGVVLFELLCGRLSIGNSQERQPLTELVRKCYKQNTMDEIIFGNSKDEINPHSLKTFITIAYQCLKREREQRPLMIKVVKVLESALQLQVSNVPPPPSLSPAEPSASKKKAF
ncbi:kinase-like domain, phloem protein 2-like protein [Tanacetum coccineum]